MAIKASSKFIFVIINKPEGKMIHEYNDQRYRNSGTVISIGEEVTEVSKGDVVHFGDMSGIHVNKKIKRELVVIEEGDIMFVSSNPEHYIIEDLGFFKEEVIEKFVKL